MKTRSCFVLIVLLNLLASTCGFAHLPQGASPTILSEAETGQRLIFERRYDEAQRYFTTLAQKYPDSPFGTFGLMALANAQMFENYDFSKDQNFSQASEANQKIVEKIVKNRESSAWDLFLCGASSGLRGFYHIRQDRAFKALKEAKTSEQCLERAAKLDPGFQDLSLGLGMYEYWRSVFTNTLRFLPFFKDRRDAGIAKIQNTIQNGVVARNLAEVALMFVNLQERKAQAGLELTRSLLARYPDNVIALLHEARFLAIAGKYPEALERFQSLRAKHPENSVSLFFIGEIYDRLGPVEKARESYEQYLQTKPSPAWESYARYKLGHIALRQKDRSAALRHFKAGHRVYSEYEPNLKMILKLRREL